MTTFLLLIIYIAFISLGIPDSLFGTAWPVIRFLSGDAEIYSLTVCRHIPLTAEKEGNS